MPDRRGLGGYSVRAPCPSAVQKFPSHPVPDVSRSDFWAKNYASIKAANGKLPILLRESSGTAAKVTATYGASATFFSPADPTSFYFCGGVCNFGGQLVNAAIR